jgi:hypothetical protein
VDWIETASFRGDDEPCLVRASLACPVCLSGEVEWWLEQGEWEATVECSCHECGHTRAVSLNPEQTLRMFLQRGSPLPA